MRGWVEKAQPLILFKGSSMLEPRKATCKNCRTQIEWMQGLGWSHLNKGKCNKPVPIKDTIR